MSMPTEAERAKAKAKRMCAECAETDYLKCKDCMAYLVQNNLI